VQVKAFAVMAIGMVAVLGWLVASPDPTRSEQEELFRKSAPELAKSFKRVLEHSKELGIERSPASISQVTQTEAATAPLPSEERLPTAEEIREIEVLSELVQAPVNHPDDLMNRFRQAQQYYQQTHSDRAIGTLRELASMTRALQPDDPRLPDLEKELAQIEEERIQRMSQGTH
jgi:hypothetical protein